MTKKNMFHSASLRLTGIYLLIIMFISLLFSANSYARYASEIDSTINRPLPQSIRRLPIEDLQDLFIDRAEFARETKIEYRNVLILLNLAIFFGGGLLSYYLARRSLKPIEKAHEAQSRFTADASHELRTPITAMRTETEITLTEPKLTLAQAKRQLQSNIEELDKLTSLSEGLLQMARLENNNIQKELVHVDEVLRDALSRVNKKAKQKKQKIDIKNSTDKEIRVNKQSIIEAITVLLDNAIKYSPEKSKIEITTKSQSSVLEISVIDQGVGIKTADIPYVFERFYQSDSSRTDSSKSGYGIGLSIAKSVMESHGGSISVKSKLGEGSTFTLALPL